MTPAAAVERLRYWLGMTQEEFGDALGVTRGTVTRWEAGTSEVPDWLAGGLGAVQGSPATQDRPVWSDYARRRVLEAMEANLKSTPKRVYPHPRYAVLAIAMAGDLLSEEALSRTLAGLGY